MSREEIEATFAELRKELLGEIASLRADMDDKADSSTVKDLEERIDEIESTVDNAIHESWRKAD
jgi:hypothetical protein